MNWDISTGSCEVIKSNSHGVLGLKVQGDNLLAATLDDAIRVTPLTATEIPYALGDVVVCPDHLQARHEDFD